MAFFKPFCPLCGRNDSVGNEWLHANGKVYRTCFGQNRDAHLGRWHHFDNETGEPLQVRNRHDAQFFNVLSHGKPVGLRGYQEDVLYKKSNISHITAKDLEANLIDKPEFGKWAQERELEGYIITMVPCVNGTNIVGIQFRAFRRNFGDSPADGENIRTLGSSDAFYIPNFTSVNPCAIVIHEGPWGAIAANVDAAEYGNADIFSVSTLSAEFDPGSLRATLDLIFPGVPRFTLFDQDIAGVHAREKAMHVAKPISLQGCGGGKDYRDCDAVFRFESLCEAVRKELKLIEVAPIKGPLVIPSAELDACLCKLPRTEYGLMDRFVERHGRICKFIDGWRHWVVFDGTRWIRSNTRAEAMAQDVIKRLEHESHYLKED